MLFFYIRHGDPIYDPDSLTPLGIKQADAVAKRLSLFGIDRIFSSSSKRAIQTAQPTCDLLKKELTLLDFCREDYAWDDLAIETPTGKRWMFEDWDSKLLFSEKSMIQLADKWYEHPKLQFQDFKKGICRISGESDRFFLSLGYEHIKNTGKYRVVQPNNDRVALFAHQGFGIAFLSCLLDIPYPLFCNHFDMCHSGITMIEFREVDGYAIPKILTLSLDSHLYREGLPLDYNHTVRF